MRPEITVLLFLSAAASGCERFVEVRTEQTGTVASEGLPATSGDHELTSNGDGFNERSAASQSSTSAMPTSHTVPANNGSANPVAPGSSPVADNTATNQRDVDGRSMTPMDQKENSRDLGLTADIRKRIVATEGLSVNARNIKVISADGKVTLRGPVNSEAERSIIAEIAAEVAGERGVKNQLEVISDKNSDDGG